MNLFDLAGFIRHTETMLAEIHHETRHALERAAEVVEKEAKGVLGEGYGYPVTRTGPAPYDPAAPWQELAESTKDEREQLGFARDEPLLRTGALRDSISHAVETGFGVGEGRAVVGSTSDVAVYQEMGTSRIPPRPFLGGAAHHKAEEVAAICGHGVVKALVGGRLAGRLLP